MYVRKTPLFTCPISSTSRKRTLSRCTKSNPSTGGMLPTRPGFEQGRFALRGEPGGLGRLGEFERRADGFRKRPVREAGLGCPGDVGAVQALVGRVLDPHREAHPLLDALVEEELALDPHEAPLCPRHVATGLEELRPGDALVHRVELTLLAALAQRDHPVREVADVDELDVLVGRRWSRNAAAARDAVGPVGEAPSRVVWADDEPGPDVRVSVGERLCDGVLRSAL